MKNITVEYLQDFEKEIADIFGQGKIKAPVHLRGGREEYLIDIFKDNDISHNDWIFGYWDSHELALLKGVPREQVKQSILAGNSIALSYPEYNILCSGIVGSLMGTAVGTAWALKKYKKPGIVYHFCGDMSAETGIFHESVKYARNWDLPITFVVCDNGLSVMTDTRAVWNSRYPWFFNEQEIMKSWSKGKIYCDYKIIYFKYENEYPHSGLGRLIKF